MKEFLGTLVCLCFLFQLKAQFTIKGKVSSEQLKDVLEATITLEKNGNVLSSQVTDNEGFYEFKHLKKPGTYQVIAEHISMLKKTIEVEVTNVTAIADIHLEPSAYFLEPLEIKSLRASEKAPFAKTNLGKKDFEKMNLGQDLPFLLNQTPGVVINSDAGNGVGYTGIRIRGTDATRINMTINGIPYNDPESQGTFLVDLPDIISSVSSIQVQRGVGSSSNGAGAFGASLHLTTNEFNEKGYGELNNSVGSFNTWKNTIKAGTGLINDHFTVDARLSKITSDGYIDRAKTDLKSFYFSTAYVNKKSTLRLNVFSGTENTYQAWNGVPENLLQTNRTYNSAGTEKPGEPYKNEIDNYQQDHYQLFFNHSINPNLSFNTAFFLTKGAGYYEQYKAGRKFTDYGLTNPIINGSPVTKTDLIRQLWLKNDFFGQVFSIHYKKQKNSLTMGGGWNQFNGDHFGKVIWAATSIPKDYEWYRLEAVKSDNNLYAKWQHSFNTNLQFYGDLQYRNVRYNIGGFRDNPSVFVKRDFNFFNPKAGLTYTNKDLQVYLSYARASKEPNRSDFEAGAKNQPKPETLHDFELGFSKGKNGFVWGANAYYMVYNDQLILTGQINDVGAYTRINVPHSYRLGIEFQSNADLTSWLNLDANLALSDNRINSSKEFVDDYDNGGQVIINHKKTSIALSPAIVSSVTLNLVPFKNVEVSFPAKFVSRQYLDNTENRARSLQPYYAQDIRLSYKLKKVLFKEWMIIALVNNAFNKKYEPNGYTFSYISGGKANTENYYFPMAGVNFMVGANLKL